MLLVSCSAADPIKRGVDEVLTNLSGLVEAEYAGEQGIDEALGLIKHDIDAMQAMSCN